jgi:hypothetical protein
MVRVLPSTLEELYSSLNGSLLGKQYWLLSTAQIVLFALFLWNRVVGSGTFAPYSTAQLIKDAFLKHGYEKRWNTMRSEDLQLQVEAALVILNYWCLKCSGGNRGGCPQYCAKCLMTRSTSAPVQKMNAYNAQQAERDLFLSVDRETHGSSTTAASKKWTEHLTAHGLKQLSIPPKVDVSDNTFFTVDSLAKDNGLVPFPPDPPEALRARSSGSSC